MKKKIKKINKILIDHFDIPTKAKKLPDPLDTIIGTILSQNTNDSNSYKAYRNLKTKFKKWDELALLKPVQIEKYIKVAGLGKQKSKAIYELLQSLKNNNKIIALNHIKKNLIKSFLMSLHLIMELESKQQVVYFSSLWIGISVR